MGGGKEQSGKGVVPVTFKKETLKGRKNEIGGYRDRGTGKFVGKKEALKKIKKAKSRKPRKKLAVKKRTRKTRRARKPAGKRKPVERYLEEPVGASYKRAMRKLSPPEIATITLAVVCISFLTYLVLFHTQVETVVELEECNETFYCSRNLSLWFIYNHSRFPADTAVLCSFNTTEFEFGERVRVPNDTVVSCYFNTTLNYTVSPPYMAGRSLSSEYVSWSTLAECASDADCKEGGCNGELCGEISERLVSVCILNIPPSTYGHRCGCVDEVCGWYS